MTFQEILPTLRTINSHYSISEEEQEAVYKACCDISGTFVELGVAHGKTSYLLASICKENGGDYVGIDAFWLDSTEGEVRHTLEKLEVPYTLIVGDTKTVYWNRLIDVLFIDAGHDEGNISADCEKWVPFVSPGGLVMFHDWPEDDSRDNPHWAVKFYGERATSGWEKIAHVGSLEIRKK